MPSTMQQRKKRPSRVAVDAASRSKRVIFGRTVFLMLLCGIGLFIPLFIQLWDIAIVHHEEYQQKATEQQTMDLTVSASRGTIYDRTGNVLAMSATVYDLILSPRDLQASVDEKDYKNEDGELDTAAWKAADGCVPLCAAAKAKLRNWNRCAVTGHTNTVMCRRTCSGRWRRSVNAITANSRPRPITLWESWVRNPILSAEKRGRFSVNWCCGVWSG